MRVEDMVDSETVVLMPEVKDGRLSLAECRNLLPPGYEPEGQQLERVRDELYALAEAILDAAGHSPTGPTLNEVA